jgi:hypothetical protein
VSERDAGVSLDQARQRAQLSPAELWWAYFALGGTATPLDLEAILAGTETASRIDHDLLAQALNERSIDYGQDHPVPYSDTHSAPDAQ